MGLNEIKMKKTIDGQTKVIAKLREENEELKSKLEFTDVENVKFQIELAQEAYTRYDALFKELTEIKVEYEDLVKETKEIKRSILRDLKRLN